MMQRLLLSCIPVLVVALHASMASAQERGDAPGEEIPVTIKELDVRDAMREFQAFEKRLEEYRTEVSKGKKVATEVASMLDELRSTASPENGYNEPAILEAIGAYVDGVISKQTGLVDFLQSQRYRISYYANKMAASVRPADIALLFGTEEGNLRHLQVRTKQVDDASRAIARFIDTRPSNQIDRRSFQALPGLPRRDRRKLAQLELRYQGAKNALKIASTRLQLLRQAARSRGAASSKADVNVDLLLIQMFGAVDRIRLQMSMDLLHLEMFLSRHERSSRTKGILRALQQLISMQGGLEGPSPGLANVLEWLEESSLRKLSIGSEGLMRPGTASFPRSSEVLREAYLRGTQGRRSKE